MLIDPRKGPHVDRRILAVCLASLLLATGCSGKKGNSGCPSPKNGPTDHSGDVTGEVTWLADDSPHIVTNDVNVRDGAILNIEACAEVLMAAGTSIRVAFPETPNTGTLIAEGTASRPIRFAGQDDARWNNVYVHSPGTARFSHTSFSNGGGGTFSANATLMATGLGTTPTQKSLYVEDVTISNSLGAGVFLTNVAAFADESTGLVIESSGNADHPYPLEIGEHALDTLPDGSYTGNLKDEILIHPEGANGSVGLQENARMRNLGVPYHVGTPDISEGSSLRVGSGQGDPLAILTIDPGVVIRFEPGKRMSFKIEHFTGDFPASGEVHAVGTASEPIVFTSASDTPAAGDWMGLWFGGEPRAGNVFDHVRVEYAGDDCACGLLGCNLEVGSSGAVIFTNEPPSAFITNSTITHSATHGVVRGYAGADVDFRPSNTIENVAGCRQTLNAPPEPETCPDPLPSCMTQ